VSARTSLGAERLAPAPATTALRRKNRRRFTRAPPEFGIPAPSKVWETKRNPFRNKPPRSITRERAQPESYRTQRQRPDISRPARVGQWREQAFKLVITDCTQPGPRALGTDGDGRSLGARSPLRARRGAQVGGNLRQAKLASAPQVEGNLRQAELASVGWVGRRGPRSHGRRGAERRPDLVAFVLNPGSRSGGQIAPQMRSRVSCTARSCSDV